MVFEVQFSRATDGPATKNVEPDGMIELDGVHLQSKSSTTIVKFKCVYDLSVEVMSSAFSTSRGAGSSWDTVAYGSLGKGFNLTLDSHEKHLGKPLHVTAEWRLNLSGVQFYFQKCQVGAVTEGAVKVPIISNGCYAEALRVSRREGTITEQNFVFPTFTVHGEDNSAQVKIIIIISI